MCLEKSSKLTRQSGLTYSIVIATRNRPEALALSLPCMLRQTRSPEQIIIVDASDQPDKVVELVKSIQQDTAVSIKLEHYKPGTTLQRNYGLSFVNEDVTIFLDDYSLPYPDAASEILSVYDLDTEKLIGGVCAAEAMISPISVSNEQRTSIRDKVKLKVSSIRRYCEDKIITDPFILMGQSQYLDKDVPKWLALKDAHPVEYMTGFRMSFRTEVIRQNLFNEEFAEYGLFEDIEASLRIGENYLIVGANRSRIYHNRRQGPRARSIELGFFQLLNRALIVCSIRPESIKLKNALSKYSTYKITQYFVEMLFSLEPGRLLGALKAIRHIKQLKQAQPSDMGTIYRDAKTVCTNG